MRIILAAVGRLKAGPDRELFDRYWERLNAGGIHVGMGPLTLTELSESRASTAGERKTDEAGRLSKSLTGADFLIALDERGKSMTSENFAKTLRERIEQGTKTAAFIIGGPDGHDSDFLSRANLKLSLGALTLPHGLARIVLAEQLYRASTILAGHPYHRA